MIILTGSQRIRPGLSGPQGLKGDLFCHALKRQEQAAQFPADVMTQTKPHTVCPHITFH